MIRRNVSSRAARGGLFVFAAGASVFALATLVGACADSDDEGAPPSPTPDAAPLGEASTQDGGTDAGDAAVDAPEEATVRECSKEGYCPTTVPPKQSLRAVWADGQGITWAVSEEGAVLRYDGTWKVHATLGEPLLSIWGSGPADVWIGSESNLFHSAGAGSATLTFEAVAIPGPSTPISSIWGSGPNDVYFAGGRNDFPLVGRVVHTDGSFLPAKDGGVADAGPLAFTEENVTKEALWIHRVFGSAASGLWVAGTRTNPDTSQRQAVLYRRKAGESTYALVTLPGDPDMGSSPLGQIERLDDAAIAADGATIWVLGRTHTAVTAYVEGETKNGGQTFGWSFHENGKNSDPTRRFIGASTANDVWIGGDFGRLSHFGGTSWKQALVTVSKFPVIEPFYAMGGPPQNRWFVGDGIALHLDPSKAQP